VDNFRSRHAMTFNFKYKCGEASDTLTLQANTFWGPQFPCPAL